MAAPLLQVRDLRVKFRTHGRDAEVVKGMSFEVGRGETLAILGESGSGKTVSAMAVMGLLEAPPAEVTGGEIIFGERDLLKMSASERRGIAGSGVAMVFQDALASLNPVFSVGFQVGEIFRKRLGMSRRQAQRESIELLRRVEIPQPEKRIHDYPYQFSGGMRQRVMIAMAIALEPAVLIADEPTTALDVTVQAQIMELLQRLQAETGMGIVIVTHDLGLVAEVADRVSIVYAGRVVETGNIADVYRHPGHPYTLGLLRSLPRADLVQQSLAAIEGSPPPPTAVPQGCEFHPRCGFERALCSQERPELIALEGGRSSACFFVEEVLGVQR